jgi:hypothetical protein
MRSSCTNCGNIIEGDDGIEWVDTTPDDAPPNATNEVGVCSQCGNDRFVIRGDDDDAP